MRSVSFLFRIYRSVLGLDDGDVELVQLFCVTSLGALIITSWAFLFMGRG